MLMRKDRIAQRHIWHPTLRDSGHLRDIGIHMPKVMIPGQKVGAHMPKDRIRQHPDGLAMLKVTLFLRYLHRRTLKDLLRKHLDGIAMPKVTLCLR